MLISTEELIELYQNPNKFSSYIEYTTAHHRFRTELIEKDYLCSLILLYLFALDNHALTFKGGTSLAKIHAGFYRMSEDLGPFHQYKCGSTLSDIQLL